MEIEYEYGEGEEEEHRGVKRTYDGYGVQTYEHVKGFPGCGSEYYRVTTLLRFVSNPWHINKYYLPCQLMDEFFMGYGETSEEVIDVRPITVEEAVEEWAEYDDDFSKNDF